VAVSFRRRRALDQSSVIQVAPIETRVSRIVRELAFKRENDLGYPMTHERRACRRAGVHSDDNSRNLPARRRRHARGTIRARARRGGGVRAEERLETMRGDPEEGLAARGSEGKGLRGGGVQGQERRDKERTDETTGAGEKEITAGSDRVVEINVARLIGATEECACGLSGSQPALRDRLAISNDRCIPALLSRAHPNRKGNSRQGEAAGKRQVHKGTISLRKSR